MGEIRFYMSSLPEQRYSGYLEGELPFRFSRPISWIKSAYVTHYLRSIAETFDSRAECTGYGPTHTELHLWAPYKKKSLVVNAPYFDAHILFEAKNSRPNFFPKRIAVNATFSNCQNVRHQVRMLEIILRQKFTPNGVTLK